MPSVLKQSDVEAFRRKLCALAAAAQKTPPSQMASLAKNIDTCCQFATNHHQTRKLAPLLPDIIREVSAILVYQPLRLISSATHVSDIQHAALWPIISGLSQTLLAVLEP